jgi:D-alanyl-D-alanine carboxypeptidase (penicillin-binding protein 5/6)
MKQRISLLPLVMGLVALSLAMPGTPALAATQSATKKSTKQPTKHYGISKNPYLGAIVLEASTGRVLFEDQADAKGYPASVLKLMDLLIILERIQQGQLSLQDQVPVSAKAAKTGGSQVYLAEKESFPVEDMLYALMVQSANDAAVALAEKVGGTTDAFVELMNKRARELGMTSTVFRSVHGLPPAQGQEHDVTTARDLGILCREILKHPEALKYTSTRERPFRQSIPAKMVNMRTHNHLLANVEGCDGLKTGYITAAGFSIAVTGSKNGQRIVVVVLDSIDLKTRDAKARELYAKGFAALSAAGSPAPAASAAAPASKPAANRPSR